MGCKGCRPMVSFAAGVARAATIIPLITPVSVRVLKITIKEDVKKAINIFM